MREKLTQQGLLLTPGSIDEFVALRERRHGARREDRRRREDPCRMMTDRAARSSPAASSGIGQAHRRSDCWPTAGACTASTCAAPRIEHGRFEPVRVDLHRWCRHRGGSALALSDVSASRACGRRAARGTARRVARRGRRADVAAACRRGEPNRQRRAAAMAAHRDGRVVLIGSRVAQGKAGRSQYAASKAAFDRASRAAGRPRSHRRWRDGQRRLARRDADRDAGRSRAQDAKRRALPPLGRLIRPGRNRGPGRPTCCHLRRRRSPARTSRSAAALRCRADPPPYSSTRMKIVEIREKTMPISADHPQRVHRLQQDDAEPGGGGHRRDPRRQAGGRLRLQLERPLRPGHA